MTCTHDITERDIAVSADGMCPLCMAAEIERLRTALQEIAALPPVDGLDEFEINRRGQELRLNEQGRSIARRALEQKP